MAEQPASAGKQKRARSKAVATAAALFPLLVSAGVFAPGLVQLALQVSGALGEDRTVGGGPGPFEHHPLPAPRDPVLVFTPVSVELDRLFFESLFRGAHTAADAGPGARGRDTGPGDGIVGFPRHDAASIVLDPNGGEEEVVFKDALIPDQKEELAQLDPSRFFLPLCPVIPSLNCLRFDDFTRVTHHNPVPEPASAALFGMGLLLLGARRRR